jgi:hypothetical protein
LPEITVNAVPAGTPVLDGPGLPPDGTGGATTADVFGGAAWPAEVAPCEDEVDVAALLDPVADVELDGADVELPAPVVLAEELPEPAEVLDARSVPDADVAEVPGAATVRSGRQAVRLSAATASATSPDETANRDRKMRRSVEGTGVLHFPCVCRNPPVPRRSVDRRKPQPKS